MTPTPDFSEIPERLIRKLQSLPLIVEERLPGHTSWATSPEVTPGQVRILEALSHGMGYKGAADLLGLSPETIKWQAQGARYRLRAKNTTHAVAIALRKGLIK